MAGEVDALRRGGIKETGEDLSSEVAAVTEPAAPTMRNGRPRCSGDGLVCSARGCRCLAEIGLAWCMHCRDASAASKAMARARGYVAPRDHSKEYEVNKARKHRTGTCLHCSMPVDDGRRLCQDCYDRRRLDTKDLRARRVMDGKCSECGLQRGADGTSIRCRPCADASSRRSRKYRSSR